MDPLDQHLVDAGAAWRQAQPEPPDLDRMIATLDRGRRRGFSSRFTFVFVAGLLLLAAVAAAPGVGAMLNQLRNGLPATATATASPSPTPSAPPASQPGPTPTATATALPTATPVPDPSSVSDAVRAATLVDAYEAALVAGQWQTAFDMLAPASPTHGTGVAAYEAERAPYYESVAGEYSVGTATRVTDGSQYDPLIDGADLSRAYLVEVAYPAMAGNNAGYEQFVVAPDTSGTWRIWPVR